jgi:hypothetical protein
VENPLRRRALRRMEGEIKRRLIKINYRKKSYEASSRGILKKYWFLLLELELVMYLLLKIEILKF